MENRTRIEPTTRYGHSLFEVSSVFQKSIRRGLLDEALYWGVEMEVSGYGEYAWKRMRVIVSEDVGIAEPHMPAVIHALYENYQYLKPKATQKLNPHRMPFLHAIFLLTTAKKSRAVDHALWYFYKGTPPKKEIPDWAFDKHTIKGRKMGRSWDHFFAEGEKLANAIEFDPYKELGRRSLTGETGNLFGETEPADEV